MERSRRGGTKAEPPAASRLTVRKKHNRKRPGSLWSRMPKPSVAIDACGRAVRRSVPALAAAAAIATVGTGAYYGYRFLTTSPRFAIAEIEISGEQHLTEDQIRAQLPVKLGDNVFATSLDKVARSLSSTPWIAHASAHRELPNKLVVEITEHAPAALVDLGDLYLVDTTGHAFKRVELDVGDGEGLPVITGIPREMYEADPDGTAQTIVTALAALTAWTADPQRPAIGEMSIDAHRQLTLRTYENAVAIQLGPLASLPQMVLRMATFDAVWGELSDSERARARALHLDARTDQVTVALHTETPKD